MAHTISLHKAS